MRKVALLFIFIAHTVFSQEKEPILYQGSSTSIEHLLQKFIQIPSLSGEEKRAGDFIKSVTKENKLFITEFGNTNGNYNFAASIFPLDLKKPNIIFLNHIDEVPEIELEKSKSYSGQIIDNKLYGRGAIDNKGVALMQLYSIVNYAKFKDLKSKYNITFLAVSCEETQCEGGVNYVINNYLEELNPFMVIGEGPSELTSLIGGEFKNAVYGISVAHKRSFWLNLELEIETNGHGSITPIDYSNKAFVKALNNLTKKKNKIIYNDINVNILKSLGSHKKGVEKLVLRHPKLFKPFIASKLRKQPELLALFTNTITLTNIYTNNNSYNSIPSKASAFLDCRLLPSTSETEFLKLIKNRLNNDSIKISIEQHMPYATPSSTETDYYQTLEKTIKKYYTNTDVLPIIVPNINDLGAFRQKGIPSYGSIPVSFSREEVEGIHNSGEYISIPHLYNGMNVYFNFIKEIQRN